MGRTVDRYVVTCPTPVGGYTPSRHYEVWDRRYAVWRCNDRNCADAQYAKQTGQQAFHIEDRETGEVTTDFNPIRPDTRQGQE